MVANNAANRLFEATHSVSHLRISGSLCTSPENSIGLHWVPVSGNGRLRWLPLWCCCVQAACFKRRLLRGYKNRQLKRSCLRRFIPSDIVYCKSELRELKSYEEFQNQRILIFFPNFLHRQSLILCFPNSSNRLSIASFLFSCFEVASDQFKSSTLSGEFPFESRRSADRAVPGDWLVRRSDHRPACLPVTHASPGAEINYLIFPLAFKINAFLNAACNLTRSLNCMYIRLASSDFRIVIYDRHSGRLSPSNRSFSMTSQSPSAFD